jgi:hypothetical protein
MIRNGDTDVWILTLRKSGGTEPHLNPIANDPCHTYLPPILQRNLTRYTCTYNLEPSNSFHAVQYVGRLNPRQHNRSTSVNEAGSVHVLFYVCMYVCMYVRHPTKGYMCVSPMRTRRVCGTS